MTFSSLDHYMTEVHSDIELRFGNPSTEEKQEFINNKAIEFDLSVERALIVEFEHMFTDVWMRKNGDNLFELLFMVTTGEDIRCRNVTVGTYAHNGTKYPKVTIHGDYLDKVDSNGRLWINDEMVDAIGKEIDINFEYSYVDFLRIKK